MIEQPDGSIAYTRNGNFQLSVNTSGGLTLSTSDGYAVLDSTGNPITFDANVDTTKLTFDNYGNIKYVDATEMPKILELPSELHSTTIRQVLKKWVTVILKSQLHQEHRE